MSRFKKCIDWTSQYCFSRPPGDPGRPGGVIYSVVDDKVVINHEKIESLKKYKLVIANLSIHNWDERIQKMCYDLLDEHGVNFIHMTNEPSEHQQRPRTYFYPYHLYEGPDELTWPEFDPKHVDKKFLVSSLNGVPRPHRIQTYMMLRKKSYYDQCLVNFHGRNMRWGGETRGDDEPVDPDLWEEWLTVKSALPEFEQDQIWKDVCHPAYTDSYINLVTETTVTPRIYLTEKTWKPIGCGQLFLFVSNPGTVAHLRNMEVDCFDDYIDHNYYDSELDFKTRLRKMYEILDDLVTQDLRQIYIDTQDRRAANRQKFFDSAFDNQGWHQQVVDIIKANQ